LELVYPLVQEVVHFPTEQVVLVRPDRDIARTGVIAALDRAKQYQRNYREQQKVFGCLEHRYFENRRRLGQNPVAVAGPQQVTLFETAETEG
jgi:hypothetical protein